MDPIAGIERFEAPADGVVLTIGNFDGVHLGHQALLEAACEIARQPSVPVVVITFDPHPLAILAPERAPARLTTLEERTTLLAVHGADHVIVLRSDRDLLSKTAEQFLKDVVTRYRPRDFVERDTAAENFTARRGANLRNRAHRNAGYDVLSIFQQHRSVL